jgi:hypothetical protein
MTNEQAREVFNQVLATRAFDADISKVELAREYFCNPTFRKALEDYVWEMNNRGSK